MKFCPRHKHISMIIKKQIKEEENLRLRQNSFICRPTEKLHVFSIPFTLFMFIVDLVYHTNYNGSMALNSLFF